MVSTSKQRAGFPLASHFFNPDQQEDASTLGIWLFLATEILMFGGLFVTYLLFLYMHPQVFKDAHRFLDVRLGALNTVVLLFSSLTVVLAIHAAQKNKKNLIILNLVVTILCALTFMVVKYFEYKHKFHAGLLPGYHFTNGVLANPDESHVFFSIYFMMTGLHGIHVLIGIGIFVWLLVRSIRGEFNTQYHVPLKVGGLYWHLVDIIWIFLFPLLYLIR